MANNTRRLSEVYQDHHGIIRANYSRPHPTLCEPEITVQLKRVPRRWTPGDWFCAIVSLAAVVWIALEILPAFFDGRVAQVVGG